VSHKRRDYVYDFLTYLRMFAPPTYCDPRSKEHPDGEYKPIPGRRYQTDAAWPSVKVAVEIDGGNWMARKTKRGRCVCVGRHSQSTDYKKLNLMQWHGWRVLRFTPDMLKQDPAACIAQVVELIEQ